MFFSFIIFSFIVFSFILLFRNKFQLPSKKISPSYLVFEYINHYFKKTVSDNFNIWVLVGLRSSRSFCPIFFFYSRGRLSFMLKFLYSFVGKDKQNKNRKTTFLPTILKHNHWGTSLWTMSMKRQEVAEVKIVMLSGVRGALLCWQPGLVFLPSL